MNIILLLLVPSLTHALNFTYINNGEDLRIEYKEEVYIYQSTKELKTMLSKEGLSEIDKSKIINGYNVWRENRLSLDSDVPNNFFQCH